MPAAAVQRQWTPHPHHPLPPRQVPEGAAHEPGTSIRAAILDVNKREGILDLSLQPRLLQAAAAAQAATAPDGQSPPKRKKQRKGAAAAPAEPAAPAELKEGDAAEATIELVSCRRHCQH